jgi:hypothetical protein
VVDVAGFTAGRGLIAAARMLVTAARMFLR